MRLTLITIVVLALTVASTVLNFGDLITRLGILAITVLVAIRVLIWLAGDGLYAPRIEAAAETESTKSGESPVLPRVDVEAVG